MISSPCRSLIDCLTLNISFLSLATRNICHPSLLPLLSVQTPVVAFGIEGSDGPKKLVTIAKRMQRAENSFVFLSVLVYFCVCVCVLCPVREYFSLILVCCLRFVGRGHCSFLHFGFYFVALLLRQELSHNVRLNIIFISAFGYSIVPPFLETC